MEILEKNFKSEKDKVLMNVCAQLSNYGKKKEKDKKDKDKGKVEEIDVFQAFLVDLKDRLLSLTDMQQTFVLMEYIDNCRSVFRGDQSAMQSILTNSCGSHVDQDGNGGYHFGIPEEYLTVYSFEQIGLPKDLNMKAKVWRKVKAFMDKQFPQFFKKE